MRSPDLLILLPELALGGLLRHACDVALAAKNADIRATIVSVRGEHDVANYLSGLDVRLIGGWTGESREQVLGWMANSDVLLLSSPQTALVAPMLCHARSAVVGVHGSPGTNREWLGPERFALLTAALAVTGGPRVVVPGRAYVDGVARELGIPSARVRALPNATFPVLRPLAAIPGMSSVLAPMRLSREKAWVLQAAAQLARQGGVPLKVVGCGPAAAEFRAWLRAQRGLTAELVETGDLQPHLRTADVVVAVGLVALEAAAHGRRVAVAAKPGGGLAGALTAESWKRLQATNFAGLGLPEQSAQEVWTALGNMAASDLAEVIHCVSQTASPNQMLQTLRRQLRRVRPPSTRTIVSAYSRLVGTLEHRLESLTKDAASLENARNWWREQTHEANNQLRDATGHLHNVERARDEWQRQTSSAREALRQATDYLAEVEAARDDWQRQATGARDQLKCSTDYLAEVERARDEWKRQADELNSRLQDVTTYLRAVEEARDDWHRQATLAESDLREAASYLREVERARDWWRAQAEHTAPQQGS